MGTRVTLLNILVTILCLLFCGCAGMDKETALPPTPAQAWKPTITSDYSVKSYRPSAGNETLKLDPKHIYTLPEMIDLALQCNHETRGAWLAARQAQTAVHAAESAYFPRLDAVFSAGHERVPFPLPQVVFPKGYFYADIYYGRPEIQFNWVVLDFGRRDAVVEGAEHVTAAAGFTFNAALQTIYFRVAEAYYSACVATRHQQVTQSTLKETAMVLEKAEIARKQGLANRTELLEARHLHAKAAFEHTAAITAARQARLDLTDAIGIEPTPHIRIEKMPENPSLDPLEKNIQRLLDEALENRPQLRSKIAQLKAAEAGIEEAESDFLPRLVLNANGGPLYNAFSIDDFSRISTFEMAYGASIALSFNLFNGDLSKTKLQQAKQLKESLENELILEKNRIVYEVWTAYDTCKTARDKLASADSLLKTAQSVYDDANNSQTQGMATMLDVIKAHIALQEARLLKTGIEAEIAITAIGLKRATGTLNP